MELHHRLRRDPSWHPNSCNICGQLGHQAAQCTVGTVNWKNMYGAEAFLLRPPLFWSQIQAVQKSKHINFEELEKSAREYATTSAAGSGRGAQANSNADLPPGWSTARDAQGKVYYWHRETKAVQWQKPSAPAPPAAADDEELPPANVDN